jgi:hypothetical protein
MRIGELADAAGVNTTCRHTRSLLIEHLADRATNLDPTACTDPNRCQVIDTHRHPPTP